MSTVLPSSGTGATRDGAPRRDTSPTYFAGLDGLRALAVLAVLAYHLDFGWASGGLLGVEVFFVLSGYLITDLLVAEFDRHGRINLRAFWARRARRLLPALFVMLIAVVGWATVTNSSQLPGLRSDLPSAVGYYSNWWFIYQHVPYFARFGPPSPIGHLWSLAIEEQFYLLWPLLLLILLRAVRSRRVTVGLVLAAAAASAIEMRLLYSPLVDPVRIYDGTDTRAFALLIGAALALGWRRDKRAVALTPAMGRALNAAAFAALGGVVLLFCLTNEYASFLYPVGMLLCSLCSVVLIVAAVHPGVTFGRALGVAPLRWIGRRSYGIYLWSYPVVVFASPTNGHSSTLRLAVEVGITFVLAALSWRFVEQPIRRHGFAYPVRWLRAQRSAHPWLSASAWLGTCTVVASVGICVVGLSGVVEGAPLVANQQVTAILPRPKAAAPSTADRDDSHPAGEEAAPSPTAVTTSPAAVTTSTSASPEPKGTGVTAIGDSIMIDAAPFLRQLLPGITIDAVVGQQLVEVQAAVPKLRAEGAIGDRLIVELGTNGPYTPAQLVELLHSLGPMRRIVLVNTYVDRPWEAEVNATIATVARTYPNVTLVDWNALGAEHPSYFYPDGVHLNPEGGLYFARLLVKALG